MDRTATSPDLVEQLAFYRAVAREYFDHTIDVPGSAELLAAIEAFRPTGDVLELACGTGVWTQHLLASARSITAVDGAPEMLDLARARVPASGPVRFVQADLFTWLPDRRYDTVFFGFWISHVPEEQFEPFWSMIDDALEARRDGLLLRRQPSNPSRADRRPCITGCRTATQRWHLVPGHQGPP